tara:strand:+ start:1168 stop:1503 length:336 start_codon:yes stop_codon:yes gene_type:complete
MKIEKLKLIIKEATREVIREELKEILLEAVRRPAPIINENTTSPTINSNKESVKVDLRSSYRDILGETANTMTTSTLTGQFQPNPNMDSANGALPSGQVSLDQIGSLLKNN